MQFLGALAQRDGDLVTAFRWYRRAAEHGSGEAVKALGEAYYRGQGVPRNPVLAFAYLRIAVNRMGVAVPSTILGRIAADLSPTQQAEAEDLVRGWTAGTRLPEESRSWTQ
jgi:TPR repeat protein